MNQIKVKIGTSTITQPNKIGIVIKETPKMFVVNVTKNTFESKKSGTGIVHKFDKGQREWFGTNLNQIKRFWKHNLCEVGGNSFIITFK